MVCEVPKLMDGYISVTHKKGTGFPSISNADDNIEHVHDAALLNRLMM